MMHGPINIRLALVCLKCVEGYGILSTYGDHCTETVESKVCMWVQGNVAAAVPGSEN